MSVPPLLATCWTHAGDAAPQRGTERSPLDIVRRVEELGRAGWKGIGLVHADLLVAAETIGYKQLSSVLAGNGLEFVEVEFLGDWWTTGSARTVSDAVRRDLFEAAGALGAKNIKVAGKMFDQEANLDRMASAFDQLADEARDVGARISLEALPFSNFSTVGGASQFVTEVGNANGGLIVDIWHVYRGGNRPTDLLHELNPNYLFAVELNDAREPAPPYEALWSDTVDARLLPGEGDWDLPGFINVIRALGFDGAWGVEVLSEEHRRRPLDEAVTTALRAAHAVFEEADRQAAEQRTLSAER